MLSSLFLTSLLALSSISVSAAPSSPVEVVQERGLLTTLLGGSTCPKGYTSGSVTNKAAFPVSMSKIKPTVDSFFDAAWEGFTTASTTGKDNVPGAVRSFSFGGILPLTEQLTSYVDASPVLIDRVWKGVGGEKAGTLPVVASMFQANLSSWTEHFTITPSCFGKAITLTWTATYCSTNDPVAESLFGQAHTGPIAGLEQVFGTFTKCT
ncbi:hypothetical protein BDY24DRAFT_441541 [Mrakia frigida]|uniref:uncharacterized protein n=1 Tax=Mrakia frigida TaxID=29902 RepID=UPI003FCBEE90